jgi:hypothetical protein
MHGMSPVHFRLHNALIRWEWSPFSLLVVATLVAAVSWYLRADWQWISTEFVTIAAFIPIFWQWMQSDARAAARADAHGADKEPRSDPKPTQPSGRCRPPPAQASKTFATTGPGFASPPGKPCGRARRAESPTPTLTRWRPSSRQRHGPIRQQRPGQPTATRNGVKETDAYGPGHEGDPVRAAR